MRFRRFLSVDSAKAVKAQEYGYLNGINYMAPHPMGGRGNLCPNASAGCIALCLGWYSGQAAMLPTAQLDTGRNAVRASRIAKVQAFMDDRPGFMREMALAGAQLIRDAKRHKLTPCMRPNGATDIAWEGIRVVVDASLARDLSRISGEPIAPGIYPNIMALYPRMQFVDYTKNPRRFSRKLPANYCLTFSAAEDNHAQCAELLARGVNVAAVFRKALPETWQGFPVIDGDKHDLRHLDTRGVVVGLLPKGNRAKRDASGFVIG